jgi:hypothetical protein
MTEKYLELPKGHRKRLASGHALGGSAAKELPVHEITEKYFQLPERLALGGNSDAKELHEITE